MTSQSIFGSRVAIVIPVLNEERYITGCLASLRPQAQQIDAEIIVADGGSSDDTVAIVKEFASIYGGVSLLHNPGRLQSAALNLAAKMASADVGILVRADAHAVYPKDFLQLSVNALRTHNATSVVVPMHTVGHYGMQLAIAAVQNSRLGNGGAAHRVGGVSGNVDHGHHAAFDREFFLRIGGYDENFSHNEDAEHDVRSHQAGGRIWMCREAAINYFPRAALWPLARQYFRHGRGRMQTLLRHKLRPRPRQLAAPVVLIMCLLGMLAMPVSPWFGLIPFPYIIACATWSIVAAIRAREPWLLAIAPAVMTIHFSWGAGFLYKLITSRTINTRRRTSPSANTTAATVG